MSKPKQKAQSKQKPEQKTGAEYDNPWKTILERYFEQFMAFCFPDKHTQIDWKKGYKCLDKELTKISRGSLTGNRIVDKLIELFLKNGKKVRILAHLEIQGRSEPLFEERLFIYRYRLRDRYACPIATIAILIDKSKTWRPNSFYEELLGSSIEMKFPIVKILDYKNRKEELEQSSNPFAVVILAQLASMEEKDPETKLVEKWGLIKRLYEKGWVKKDIVELLIFIDWVLVLPPELDIKCKEQLDALEEEEKVRYVTSFERLAREEGVEEGERNILLKLLKYKFSTVPDTYFQRVKEARNESLMTWCERVLDSDTLEQIFEGA